MLASYQTDLNNLLQSPVAPQGLYSSANLTLWINKARGQIAGEGECVRYLGTINTVIGQRGYRFADINTGVQVSNGIQGVIHIRRIQYGVASGQKWVNGKSWEWFDRYKLSNPVPNSGSPETWAQYAQGSATVNPPGSGAFTSGQASGTFWLDPVPDLVYSLSVDCVCYPQNLTQDSDIEAIPYLWSDAVPYFAAYLALMSAQTGQRIQEAQTMKQLYSEFVQRARAYATPAVDRSLFEQAPDPANQAAMQAGPSAAAPGMGGA